ncbi:MAG: hypothetical protein PVG42_15955 [Lysobacterales bacterium]
MTSAALQVEEAAGAARAGPLLSRQATRLLPALFQLRDVDHRLMVLEIGSALPETVNFFSEFKCRLHFVDLFGEAFVRDQQSQLSEQELRDAFARQLRFPEGTRFDLCLLWDFLGYLDDSALRAFSSALSPWIHSGTRAHGFGIHHLAIRLDNIQYGVIDRETLSVRQRLAPQLQHHPHSQIEMQEMLTCFRFERGLLLPDGKLEMLLKQRP